MKKQLGIFLAGVMVLVPLAVTLYVVCWLGSTLDALGREILPNVVLPPGVGAVILIAGVYLVGLATRFWLFQAAWSLLERIVARVPGIKTLYESVRDLLQLFGGNAAKMGKVVQYSPPGSSMKMLGIRTNDTPPFAQGSGGGPAVAVYLPFSYMFGGMTIYCEPDRLEELDMPVEQCLKLCATAFVGQGKPSEDKN
ncbi:MAG: DUF502 domain-containing protein [Phycisphaerae bacterium]|nr:DUF502 domain-containing protein [Planctomycetota bacterium]MBL7220647.1 DUF502 domain-containing protein [Phycisphaerae bacterium]